LGELRAHADSSGQERPADKACVAVSAILPAATSAARWPNGHLVPGTIAGRRDDGRQFDILGDRKSSPRET